MNNIQDILKQYGNGLKIVNHRIHCNDISDTTQNALVDHLKSKGFDVKSSLNWKVVILI